MNTIELSVKRFLTFPSLKPCITHHHKNLVYKYSRHSENIMTELDALIKEPISSQISLAKAYLYWNREYWGFAMQYEKCLKNIDVAYQNGTLDKKRFTTELIELVKKLDELSLCYYDFHYGNVKIKDDKPFLLDPDHIIKDPTIEELLDQRKNLVAIIINIYCHNSTLNDAMSKLYDPCFRNLLTNETQEYITTTLKRRSIIEEYPYQLINELDTLDKEHQLKKH